MWLVFVLFVCFEIIIYYLFAMIKQQWMDKRRSEYPLEKSKASEVESWDASSLLKSFKCIILSIYCNIW